MSSVLDDPLNSLTPVGLGLCLKAVTGKWERWSLVLKL